MRLKLKDLQLHTPYHVENVKVDFYVKNEILFRLKLIKGKNV